MERILSVIVGFFGAFDEDEQLFRIVPGTHGGQNSKETRKQNSQENSRTCQDSPGIILGQSRENWVYPAPQKHNIQHARIQGERY